MIPGKGSRGGCVGIQIRMSGSDADSALSPLYPRLRDDADVRQHDQVSVPAAESEPAVAGRRSRSSSQ
jgi:hypothetical protein